MYYTDYNYDDTYDVRRLQLLPTYRGMTEEEIRHLMAKIAALETQQWEAEVKAMLADQRKKTIEYIAQLEAGDKYKPLPTDSVQISKGVKVTPDLVDDRGFVAEDILRCLRRTMRLSLDSKKKIYL